MAAEKPGEKLSVSELQRDFIDASRAENYTVEVERADAALKSGRFLDSLRILRDVYASDWMPQDSWAAWEQTATAFVRAVTTQPLDGCALQSCAATSLSISFEEWFIAVGTSHGEAHVMRFRQPGLADARIPQAGSLSLRSPLQPVPGLSSGSHDVEVSFISGARLGSELLIRCFEKGGGSYYVLTRTSDIRPEKIHDSWFDWCMSSRHGYITAMCSSGDQAIEVAWPNGGTTFSLPADAWRNLRNEVHRTVIRYQWLRAFGARPVQCL